jgi:hypothetical protein
MSIDEIKKFNLEERIILMNNVWKSLESKEIIVKFHHIVPFQKQYLEKHLVKS